MRRRTPTQSAISADDEARAQLAEVLDERRLLAVAKAPREVSSRYESDFVEAETVSSACAEV